MATVVCQGLQSRHDLQLVESRILKLKFPSPKPHFSPSLELAARACLLDTNLTNEVGEELSQNPKFLHDQQASINRDSGAWSFVHALYTRSQDSNEEPTYIHPLVKRSLIKLSEKSLELCTENLGCETGSDMISDNSISGLTLSVPVTKEGNSNFPPREKHKTCQVLGDSIKKVINSSRSFPPPLTTMKGSEVLRVRPHREDGRLIMEAIKSTSKPSCFQVERRNGRLMLHLVKDSSAFNIDSMGKREGTEKEDMENDMECEKHEEEDGEEVMEGSDENETSEEFLKPRRCKEGEILVDNNNGLSYLKPLWVATS